ncbi:MgtC/SapB family protein [Mesorhizobium sp. WSM4303]|nr:MgtC/SapB family protein [Mesorhizobium sp. WSM4306]TRD05914.1 MgtC/SapB family protein [Mesorhizobium sp. WSM4303]
MDPLIARLGLALAIGLLVGLERGWQERDALDRSRTAGIRTFGCSRSPPVRSSFDCH